MALETLRAAQEFCVLRCPKGTTETRQTYEIGISRSFHRLTITPCARNTSLYYFTELLKQEKLCSYIMQ